MTVKYVSADTSALEKPERLVPDTDFMTPIRKVFLGNTSISQKHEIELVIFTQS